MKWKRSAPFDECWQDASVAYSIDQFFSAEDQYEGSFDVSDVIARVLDAYVKQLRKGASVRKTIWLQV